MIQKKIRHFYFTFIVIAFLVAAWSSAGCGGEAPPPSEPPADENENDEMDLEEEAGDALPEEKIVLYFANGQADKLVQETRRVVVEDRDIDVVILEELIRGPQDPDMGRTVPEDTRVNGVVVEEGIASADFSEELRSSHWGGSTGEILTVYSITNTLAERPDIDRVRFLIDGETIETLAGHIELSEPVDPDLGWME